MGSIVGKIAGPLIGGLVGGSGGSKPAGQTTTTMAPWEAAQPHLQNVLSDAGSLYSQGNFSTSPLTYHGIQQALAGYAGMSPSLYKSASGQYLDPATNPGFQTALDRARVPVDAYMAKAGRYGSGAHAGQIGEAFANVAADQYNKERLLQLQTVPTLMNIDQRFQGLNQQMDDDRYSALQKYFSFAQPAGGLGGSQSTPYYQNRAAGALGGAMAGSQLWDMTKGAFGGIFNGSGNYPGMDSTGWTDTSGFGVG